MVAPDPFETKQSRGVTTIEQEKAVLHAGGPAYAHDPDSLFHASGVVAAYFATIAANEYWREQAAALRHRGRRP